MHAIPAQTANQGLPFEKETLPGPGMYLCKMTPEPFDAQAAKLFQCIS